MGMLLIGAERVNATPMYGTRVAYGARKDNGIGGCLP
jgi:hypothetical protein